MGLAPIPKDDRYTISGPLLDRIDIHIPVPPVEFEKLSSDRLGEASICLQKPVEMALARQREPFVKAGIGHLQANLDVGPVEVRRFSELDETREQLMRAAMACPHMLYRGKGCTLPYLGKECGCNRDLVYH